MELIDIIQSTRRPELYEAGTHRMWNDEHISARLLDIHLDASVDLASRKYPTIKKTAGWILETQPANRKLKILDLGCGPGLYAEILAAKGHEVYGMDISENSISYAQGSALKNGLKINYICNNYLSHDLGREQYDLIILIYTDLGVLLPRDRDLLLSKIYLALKPGGSFIFDLLGDQDLREKALPKTWESAGEGFWMPEPYLALSESFLYEKEKVILYQHLLLSSEEDLRIYRFWTHHYNREDIGRMLIASGFTDFSFRDDILPGSDPWGGKNVWFTHAIKKII